jgi:hypothetical protein
MQPISFIRAVWGALVQPKIPWLGTWLHAAARSITRSSFDTAGELLKAPGRWLWQHGAIVADASSDEHRRS